MSAPSLNGGLSSEPLSNTIKTLLLERIVSGEYGPGERIVESRLARELEISQSPVREALRDLAAIGLIDIESRRGARVRQPTAKELRDVSEVRAELDALAARLASQRLTQDQIDELVETHERMSKALKSGDYVGMSQADAQFHRLIVGACGNEAVERVFAQLDPFARTFITLTSPNVTLDGILQQHEGILQALVAGDGDLAAERAHAHQCHVRSIFFDDEEVLEGLEEQAS